MDRLRKWKALQWFIVFLAVLLASSPAAAIDGVWHDPYGIDDLYEVQQTERYPRDPIAGEPVYIKMTTWPVEPGQATWIEWTKNGIPQPDIGGEWKYNSGNNSYWEAAMGSFQKGDTIQYTVHANKDGTNEQVAGPFEFTVTDWESVTSISGFTDHRNHVVLDAVPNTGTFSPKINIAFTADDVFRVQLSPNGTGAFAAGLDNYTVSDSADVLTIRTAKLQIKINKQPYRMDVYNADGTKLIAREYDGTVNRNLAWLTDGNAVIQQVQAHYYTPANEEFYGFGERYGNFRKRGTDVDNYVYNQYLNQDDRTYLSIPFFINTNGYGILVNSTYYSKFRIATERADMYSFTVNTGGGPDAMLDYYFFGGDDLKDVIANYAEVAGKPDMLPKWAFGLWMSANEWDRQSEVLDAVRNAKTYDIPATAVVLEQWSDEHTFYIFNDAQYTPKPGHEALSYSDFTFPSWGRWPDPKAMAEEIHNNGMKLIMWQIPVQKYTPYDYAQKDNDEAYMIQQGYAVGDGSGGTYRLPWGTWFENSLLLDFTNPAATSWWMSKRAYLFDDIGIDGFKTDGGEMVWGRWNTFYNGKKGDEMRNQYPNEYVKAYYAFAKSKKPDAVTFSRAGTTGAQRTPIHWAGDQESTFHAFRQAMNAGLSANISGVPFWSWDLAGFTGPFPSSELYKRSIAMAAFAPIMQFHSEKADPVPSEERSPWNVAARTGDPTVIETSSKFINTRMNLLPYIYSEAKKSSDTGIPLMRAMVVEYPNDPNTYDLNEQYMFGDHLLIAPIVNEGETWKNVYLPEGEWIDFWWGAQHPGGRHISYYADVDTLPVFVKAGSILPMNLNEQYELGGTIGNDVSSYKNLVFRVYPEGNSSYQWYDDIGGGVKTISSKEQYALGQISVTLPPIHVKSTLQVFTTKPSSVVVDGADLREVSTLSDLIAAEEGWYYDPAQKFAYVKVDASASTRTVVLHGVGKVEYESEFATLLGVTTNTNHANYTGYGFVDGFETQGDSVEFDVYVPANGTYELNVRYSSAAGDASRAIYVNGVKAGDLSLPATDSWDMWNIAAMNITLEQGHHQIRVQFDSTNALGINLDHISIRW